MLSDTVLEAPAVETKPTKPKTHLLLWESAHYRQGGRRNPTWCGDWAHTRNLADRIEDVTCPRCLEVFTAHEQLEV